MKKVLLILFMLINFSLLMAQTISIDIDNAYLSVGESTTFTVTVNGDIKNIKYSEPDNIILTQIGKSSSFSIINGKQTKSYILTYRIKALKEGTLSIPLFYAETSSGNKLESEKINLYVNKLEESIIKNKNINGDFESEYVKLYIDLPDRNIYVGEAIPVKITAYFSSRYQPGIQRAPYIKTGSFLIDSNDKYSGNRPEKVINGEPWIEIVWDAFLTPLKSGKLDLEIIIDSYIDKPDNGGGFFSSSTREELKTSTESAKITVLPLPLQNRPSGFTGAIGEFNINSSINKTEAKVGDPLTLSIDIYGKGNFQRITIPKLNQDADKWKLYPESSTYNGTNGSNYQGVKNFEQILSPKDLNITKLPQLKFSYFNPIEEEYKELSTNTYPLKITPGEFQNKKNTSVENIKFKDQKQIMRHQKSSSINKISSILKTKMAYIILILSTLFLITSVILYILWHKKESNKNNTNKLQHSIFKEIEKEENNKNYTQALILFKKLISQKISTKKNCNPAAITSNDLKQQEYKIIFDKIEEDKYTSNKISELEYLELTKNIKELLL